MIQFLKIAVLIIVSCFLTTGHAFASIQVAQETVSCCKSSSETKDCCKNKTTTHNESSKNATCAQLIPNIVLFSEKTTEIDMRNFYFKTKNQPENWEQLHFTNTFLAIWQPPQISLNL